MTWTDGSLILGENVDGYRQAKALANGKTVELASGSVLTVSGANDNTALNLNASGTGTISVGLGTNYGANVLNMSTEFQGTLSVTARVLPVEQRDHGNGRHREPGGLQCPYGVERDGRGNLCQ